MKTNFLCTLAAICLIAGLSVHVANADVVAVSTNLGDWGTVFSDVEKEAYYHKAVSEGSIPGVLGEVTYEGRYVKGGYWASPNSKADTVDTWQYRAHLLGVYLKDTLGSNYMSTGTDALGVLHKSSNSLVAHDLGTAYGKSKNVNGNIYGQAAEILSGNAYTSNVASQLFRPGTYPTGVITSSASPTTESPDHNWFYDAATDKFTSNSLNVKRNRRPQHRIVRFRYGF
ncbi:MAG: hypothetical protein LBP59_06645 [Planctomycetaceae bacterium]|jgi:hypothetical protein|nr:hypothetical protein [Planctomycetaceae bacterium]